MVQSNALLEHFLNYLAENNWKHIVTLEEV